MRIPYKMADKCKQKINKLIKQILGSNFYFVHATPNALPILKDGEIKIGTMVKHKNFSIITKKIYVYAFAVYDNNKMKVTTLDAATYALLIDPRIIFDHDIIFNHRWSADPIINSSHEENSIFLNKNDSDLERLYKLKLIKKIIDKNRLAKSVYYTSHEFLFPENIDLHKYLIGFIFFHGSGGCASFFREIKNILNILKNDYSKVKVFKESCLSKTIPAPTLIDLLC